MDFEEKTPLVSVIITCYLRDEYLPYAIESVFNQTIGTENIEVIVVDDGTPDDRIARICELYSKVKYYYKTNSGLSSARNYGIDKANGSYIAFLDDDDFWRKDKLEIQLREFELDKNIGLVHSACEVVDIEGTKTGEILGSLKEKAHLRSGYVFWNALGVWVVKSPTPLIKKETLLNIRFDESIKVGEDVEFYQRYFYTHKIKYISEPLACYREYSSTAMRLSQRKIDYIGIELKLYNNLNNSYNINFIDKYRIAFRLCKASYNRLTSLGYNLTYPRIFFWCFPFLLLKKFSLNYPKGNVNHTIRK